MPLFRPAVEGADDHDRDLQEHETGDHQGHGHADRDARQRQELGETEVDYQQARLDADQQEQGAVEQAGGQRPEMLRLGPRLGGADPVRQRRDDQARHHRRQHTRGVHQLRGQIGGVRGDQEGHVDGDGLVEWNRLQKK